MESRGLSIKVSAPRSQEAVKEDRSKDQGDSCCEREAEGGAEDGGEYTHHYGANRTHTLIHVKNAHDPAQKIPRRLDLNNHAADGAKADLASPHQRQ